MPSLFPCSPVIRECSWNKTQIEKKKKRKRNAFLWMIAWCKCSRVIKDLPILGSFFLINLPKYLGTKLFYSLYANVTHFLKNIPLKKPVKLKRFLCKNTSSQNFLKSLVYVNVSNFLPDKISKLANGIIL